MLWCPNSGGICGETVTPLPKTALYITDVSKSPYPDRLTIERNIRSLLRNYGFGVIFAPDYKRGANVLCKICRLIQQVPIGYLIYDRTANRHAIPNIFYEASLMHYLGRDLIMIGFREKRPSDLESVEWIHYKTSEQVLEDFEERLRTILDTEVYTSFSEIEISAGNDLVGMEYLKKVLLISPTATTLERMKNTNEKIKEITGLSQEYKRNLHFVATINNWLRKH
jgi:hypothetical protein